MTIKLDRALGGEQGASLTMMTTSLKKSLGFYSEEFKNPLYGYICQFSPVPWYMDFNVH